MPDEQAVLQRFMDEASIRNAIARFADSATRADYAMCRAVWAADGGFVIGQPPHQQRATGAGEVYYRNHCVGFDRLRRAGDEWVFTSRSFQYLWLDVSPFTGSGFPLFPDSAAV